MVFRRSKVADQSVVQLSSHSQCRLGIRPEDLHLITNDDSRAYPIQLTNLKIDLVELTGSYKLLHCHHDNHKIVAAVDSNLNFELDKTYLLAFIRKMHIISILSQVNE